MILIFGKKTFTKFNIHALILQLIASGIIYVYVKRVDKKYIVFSCLGTSSHINTDSNKRSKVLCYTLNKCWENFELL